MQKILITSSVILLCAMMAVSAQPTADTTRLTMAAAEKMFLENNLSLLAAKYNIDANKALAEQAKLWDNPVLSTDQNLYAGSSGKGKFFQHDAENGQVFIQLTQLIKTAGKRSKLAQLATDNATLAAAQFDDIMRSLRYALRSDLREIDHQLRIKAIYDTEISELKTLITGMDAQLKAGNIALKDNLRVKALLFDLQNDLVSVSSSLMPVQSELSLLLQLNGDHFVAPANGYAQVSDVTAVLPPLDSLVSTALNTRPDAKAAVATLAYQQHNLTYQQALAKPDLTLGTEYDQRSNYSPNYVGLSIALPLNIFNKNQGNIKSAQYAEKEQETLLKYQYSKITNEVQAAFNKVKYFAAVNNPQQVEFAKKYDDLFYHMLNSYEARQIGLLEFLDFADAYKDTRLKLIEQQNNLAKAVEDLSYISNTSITQIP